ncbi:MAG TPA: YCF48-related protein [Blastocatellia bacterium]|nr:YCF48-related protein [Blastocatellia bacterium]
MQTYRRVIIIVLLSLASPFASGCKESAQNSGSLDQSVAPKPGRWIAQYRSPASMNIRGTNLATFSYSSLSVISRDVVFVAGDIPHPKIVDNRIAVVIRTTDGGKSWTEKMIEQPGVRIPTINSMHFVSAETGWAVGLDSAGNGIILKTTDGGNNWAVTGLPFNQVPTTVFFIDSNNGWVGGATPPPGEEDGEGGPSDLLATTDGGTTWRSQRRLPVSITDIFFLDKSTGWAGGTRGAIYHTTDSGLTWDTQRSELETGEGPIDLMGDAVKNFAIYGIHFSTPQSGFAAAGGLEDDIGRVIGTTNGGQAWARKLSIRDKGVRDVFFLNPKVGWATIFYGHYIYFTLDGGQTWLSEQVQFEQDVPFFRIAAADDSHVWATAGGAVFFRVVD